MWSNSALKAKLFFISANALFPMILFMGHIRLWTFYVAIGFILFLASLEYFGYTPIIVSRKIRLFFFRSRRSIYSKMYRLNFYR